MIGSPECSAIPTWVALRLGPDATQIAVQAFLQAWEPPPLGDLHTAAVHPLQPHRMAQYSLCCATLCGCGV